MYSVVDFREKNNKKNLILGSSIALVLLFALTLIGVSVFSHKEVEIVDSDPVVDKPIINTFNNLDIQAKAVIVWDVKGNKILFEENADRSLPLASISKVMTALVADELLGNRRVAIQESDLWSDGDSGLVAGEVWNAKDLADFTLIVSSNDGARALASALESLPTRTAAVYRANMTFVDYMNARAKSLGLDDMSFRNPSGLDEWDLSESGAYGSAKDVALLVDYILENKSELLEATQYDNLYFNSESNIGHYARNTNEIINTIPFILASKTGYTDLAGGNLMVAFDAGINHPIIITVLGSTREGRFSDIEKLYTATRDYITLN